MLNLKENFVRWEVAIDLMIVLACIECEDGAGEVLICAEALQDDLFAVVGAAFQEGTAFAALGSPTEVGGTDVVSALAVGAMDPAGEAAEDDLVRNVEMDDVGPRFADPLKKRFQKLGLLNGARVAVEEAAAGIVGLLEFAGHDPVHEFVVDELSIGEEFGNGAAQFRALGNLRTEHFPGGKRRDAKPRTEQA